MVETTTPKVKKLGVGAFPTGKTADSIELALRIAQETVLPDGAKARLPNIVELHDAAMSELCRMKLREHNTKYISGSLGSYLGIRRTYKHGSSVEDARGHKDGRRLVLDGDSIPKKAEDIEAPFLLFPQITLSQIKEEERRIIYKPDPESAIVLRGFPLTENYNWYRPTYVFAGTFGGSGERRIARYSDNTLNRVGLVAQNFDDGFDSWRWIYVFHKPGEVKFGVPVVEADREVVTQSVIDSNTDLLET